MFPKIEGLGVYLAAFLRATWGILSLGLRVSQKEGVLLGGPHSTWQSILGSGPYLWNGLLSLSW